MHGHNGADPMRRLLAIAVVLLAAPCAAQEWPRVLVRWPTRLTRPTAQKAAPKKTPVVKSPVEESGCRDGVCPAPAAPAQKLERRGFFRWVPVREAR
jgi:hypothetical protein